MAGFVKKLEAGRQFPAGGNAWSRIENLPEMPACNCRSKRNFFLFLPGALAGLIGDHCHVVTRTTTCPDAGPCYIGNSPVWLPLVIGLATLTLAELRLRLGGAMPARTLRD